MTPEQAEDLMEVLTAELREQVAEGHWHRAAIVVRMLVDLDALLDPRGKA